MLRGSAIYLYGSREILLKFIYLLYFKTCKKIRDNNKKKLEKKNRARGGLDPIISLGQVGSVQPALHICRPGSLAKCQAEPSRARFATSV